MYVTCNFVLSCGPLPMLKAINEQYSEGYISLEARMACGLGACMGCVVKDVEGHSLRVCKDGPVFRFDQIRYRKEYLGCRDDNVYISRYPSDVICYATK